MKSLHPQEKGILWAISETPSVKKIEAMGIKWTGPKPRHLQLRPSTFPGTVEFVIDARLFIGSGKRYLTICPEPGVGLKALHRELATALANYGVRVEFQEEEKMEMQQVQVREYVEPVLTPEQGWTYCELVYEAVKTVKEYEEGEVELELQLEELRGKKQDVKQQTLAILQQLLSR